MRARASLATLIGALFAVILMQVAAVRAAGELRIEFDGRPASFEAPPVQRGNVVCVPMKGIFTRLGAVVNYDEVTHTVKAVRGKTLILLTLGKDTATVNFRSHKLEVPPFPLNGAIMVPLRFVGEAFGAAVSYDVATHVVSIRSPRSDGTITLPTVHVPPASPTPAESPSSAPSTAPSPEMAQITEFRHNATATLHAGDTLTVTMVGTPKGQASFSIPGITDKVPMKEGPDGTYTCDYKLPAGTSVKAATVYGILQVGASRAPLATAPNPLTVAPLLPHVERPAPAPGATITEKTPRIAGFFEVLGGTLDPATVRISVNGSDVTKQAYVTREFFTYTPPQPLSGRVKVDVAGRATLPGAVAADWSDNWSFEIQGGVARIQSATHGPTSMYKAGDVLEVTMIGTAGGAATFDVGPLKRAVEMREASAGTYIGSYRVQPTDRVDAAAVVVRLRVGGEEVVAQVPIPVTLGVGVAGDNAMPLTVTSPRASEPVTKTITVRGQSAPGARVRVDVMGHVPLVERDVRVGSGEATADGQGTYTVNVQLPMVVGGVKLTLVVTSSDASGKKAGPVMVPVVGK